MAKIGVITFSNTKDNYGQVLQYLAIQEYLRQRGHEPSLLRHQPQKSSLARRTFSKIYHLVFRPQKTIPKPKSELMKLYEKWSEWTERNDILHPRHFEEFRKKNFDIKTIYGYDDPYINKLDAYAIGSDQIWSYVDVWNFLGFVPKGKQLFSIAPSTGNKSFSQEALQKVSHYLSRFSFVTCREKSGLEFCKNAGYNKAVQVLDPTFLIEKETYNRYVRQNAIEVKPYLFLYLLGAESDVPVDEIFDFAHKNKLEVKYIASQGREDTHEKIWATVPEWIALMKNARYVITNSFHGMALSIVYHKQFLILPVTGITAFMNERISSLADTFRLKDRIYTDSLDILFNEIDYSTADSIVSANKDILDSKMSEIDY